jgi:hypothetical protein
MRVILFGDAALYMLLRSVSTIPADPYKNVYIQWN